MSSSRGRAWFRRPAHGSGVLRPIWTPEDSVDLAMTLAAAGVPGRLATPDEQENSMATPLADNMARARRAIAEMRAEMTAWHVTEPEKVYLAALVRLLELAVDDAAGVEAMNARTQQRADRIGGDGHTWVMHHPTWSVALDAVTAWEAAH